MNNLSVCIRTAAELALQEERKNLDSRQLLNLAMKKHSFNIFSNLAELRGDLIEEALKSKFSYFDAEDSQLFLENLKNAEKMLKEMQKQMDFPDKDILEKYLNYFYECCKFLCNNKELLYEEVNLGNGDFVRICDYITYSFENTQPDLYLPFYAEAILTVYYALEELKKYSYIENEFVKQLIVSSFTIKAVSHFEYFNIRNKVIFFNDYNSRKRYCDLSSDVLIQPILLFEKIQKYASKLNEKEVCKVNIIGAIELSSNAKRPDIIGNVDELFTYSPEFLKLCNWIQSNEVTNTHSFQFDIYINKSCMDQCWHDLKKDNVDTFKIDINNENCIIVKFHYVDYNKILYKTSIDKMIKEKNLLLLLDCSFLYEKYSKVVIDKDPMEDLFRYYPKKYESNSFNKSGNIKQIYLQLNMFSNYELVGYFEAILRDDIIRYIKQQVNNNYNGTEAFILVSDHLKAYTTSKIFQDFDQQIEIYNNQEFVLLHFDGKKRKDLSQHDKSELDSSIVFTLWDIIAANTDSTLIEYIRQRYGLNHNVIVEDYLLNVFIELMWRKDESEIFEKIHVNILNKNKESNSTNIIINDIENYLDVIFNKQCDPCHVIREMMISSFLNIFSNHISDVYQAYSFQMLREKMAYGKKTKIDCYRGDIKYQKNIEVEYTTMTKFYIDSITNLRQDFPSETLIDIISYRIELKGGIEPSIVYNKILDVVRGRDEKVYDNMKKLIKEHGYCEY